MRKYLTLQPKAIDPRTLKHKTFEVEFRGDHVHVELGGGFNVDPDMQTEYWTELKAVCEEHDCHRVLVEGVAPSGERSTGEVIGAGLRTGAVPEMWMAYCLAGFQKTDQSALYETIAATRGVRVKFFSEKQQALAWLLANAK